MPGPGERPQVLVLQGTQNVTQQGAEGDDPLLARESPRVSWPSIVSPKPPRSLDGVAVGHQQRNDGGVCPDRHADTLGQPLPQPRPRGAGR